MRMRRGRAWIITCLAVLFSLSLGLVQITGQIVRAQAPCELIVNGGFENNTGWGAGPDPVPPRYVTSPVHSDSRSLVLGLPPGTPTQQSNSSARQPVTIPADASSAILSFWYQANIPGSPSGDYAEFVLLAQDGVTPLTQSWRTFTSNGTWNQVQFDLGGWRGQTVMLDFNVHNDGGTPTAYMYLDDVSLPACPGGGTAVPPSSTFTPQPETPTSTPTLTPSPTPQSVPTYPGPTETPTPPGTPTGALPPPGPPFPGCFDLVRNGGFEEGLNWWETAPNRLPVELVSNQMRWGNASLRLGSSDQNLDSYSSVRQPIHIPAGYGQILLDFWTWTSSEAPAGSDRQEADFLAPDQRVLQKFWRVLSNDQAWVQHTFQVTAYSGQNVLLYFNVYNDGASGRTAMYLDEVHVWACNPYGPGPVEPYGPYGQKAYPQTPGQYAEPGKEPGTGVLVIPPRAQAVITGTAAAALPTVAAGMPTVAAALPTLEAAIPTVMAALPTLEAMAPKTGETAPTMQALVPAPNTTEQAAAAAPPTIAPATAAPISTTPPLALQPPVQATPAPNQTTLSLGISSTPTPLPTPAPPGSTGGPGLLSRLPAGWPIALLVILGLAAILLWLLRPRATAP